MVEESPSIGRQFARWATALRFEDLPPTVVWKAKAFLLNGLTGAVIGYARNEGRAAIQLALAEEAKADGCVILVDGRRATRSGAAFANAELMHCSALWDSYRMLIHPGPVVLAAALVTAEREGRSGQDLLVAIAAGYEFACRLGHDFVPSTAARGFRPSPIYACLGAALACALLMRLDEDQVVAAIALAANFASGLNEGPRVGSNEMWIHEPQAARNAVFAAVMAGTGSIRGAEMSIEGRAGLYNAFAGDSTGKLSYAFTGPLQADMTGITDGLGSTFKLMDVMFRIYPCAGFNQPVIELLSGLARRMAVPAEAIECVQIRMNWLETLYPSPAFPRQDLLPPGPQTTHYYAACVLAEGGYPVAGSTSPGPLSPTIEDLMSRRIDIVPERDRPMFSPHASILFKDGTRIAEDFPYARLAWDYDQLKERLASCAASFREGYAELVAAVATIHDGGDLRPVMAATRRCRHRD